MHSPFRRRGSSLLIAALLAAVTPALMGARNKVPRDKALSRPTQRAVNGAVALSSRVSAEWAALEQRYDAGEVDLDELAELRVYWAAHDTTRFAASTWTLRLMNEDLDALTAVRLPSALLEGEFEAVDEILGAYAGAVSDPPPELLLLHATALWGLEVEASATAFFGRAQSSDSVFAYYGATLEEWLRGRAEQIRTGSTDEAFVPEDLAKAESLRHDLNNRGQLGRLVVAFLKGGQAPSGGYTPEGLVAPELVAELFDTRRLELHYCYEHAGGEAGLGPGTVTIDMDVDPFGRVKYCSVQPASMLKERSLWECACEQASTLQFPLPEGPGKATVRHRLQLPLGK